MILVISIPRFAAERVPTNIGVRSRHTTISYRQTFRVRTLAYITSTRVPTGTRS
ncbi:hypothetical protein AFCDBAGC_4274 [Methylobacterium cerastii]|uniref:Uncharacterized protein n=1 Tax=Methylobacterium cerastii TaxID=932741 RepID=A0ABQ4QMB6_9HYPH|nr:hypothetical protein AFCDBAGC_4274 [Methylobacterium cerastii]